MTVAVVQLGRQLQHGLGCSPNEQSWESLSPLCTAAAHPYCVFPAPAPAPVPLLFPPSHHPSSCGHHQICPILSDLMGSMSKIESLPPDFGPKGKVKGWYSKLYAQAAAYELGEGEVRQLLFDLESAYNEFISTIR